jgi:hypothetical protein
MKKIFTLVLVLALNKGFSQLSLGMHTGASDKAPVLGLHTQLQFLNHFTAGVNLTGNLDNSSPVYLQTRLGYTIGNSEGFTVQPYAGYSYWQQNMEQKKYGGNFTKGVQLRYQLNDVAFLYTDFNMPTDKGFILSIGIGGLLSRK